MKKADIPDGNTGVAFMNNVLLWVEQKIMETLPVGFCFASGNNKYVPRFDWREDMGEQMLWIRNSGLVLKVVRR